MSKNTFFLMLGLGIAITTGGFTGALWFALMVLVFGFAGVAYEAIAAFLRGFRAGAYNPTVQEPIYRRSQFRVIKGGKEAA